MCRVVPADDLVDEALKMAGTIAGMSQPITAMCKEAVNASYEMSLAEGVRFERRLFHTTFATVGAGRPARERAPPASSHPPRAAAGGPPRGDGGFRREAQGRLQA